MQQKVIIAWFVFEHEEAREIRNILFDTYRRFSETFWTLSVIFFRNFL